MANSLSSQLLADFKLSRWGNPLIHYTVHYNLNVAAFYLMEDRVKKFVTAFCYSFVTWHLFYSFFFSWKTANIGMFLKLMCMILETKYASLFSWQDASFQVEFSKF